MPTCSKDYEIELSDGRSIEVTVHVDGYYDENFGADADGNRGQGRWLIDSWEVEHQDDLDDDEQTELHEKVEEKVFDESWDFENASDSSDESDLDVE